MKLSPEQQTAVNTWIAGGASVADVQKRLNDEFQIAMTFMDTRFMIDDLGLDIKPPAPKPVTPPPAAVGPAAPKSTPPPGNAEAELVDDEDAYADAPEDLPPDAAPAGAGSVKVEIDLVMRPGTVVSGTVTFSDGQTGKWALDQYGRLMFDGSTPGYRPAPADLQVFQRELSAVLQRQGY